jgi:hypothetical protein
VPELRQVIASDAAEQQPLQEPMQLVVMLKLKVNENCTVTGMIE